MSYLKYAYPQKIRDDETASESVLDNDIVAFLNSNLRLNYWIIDIPLRFQNIFLVRIVIRNNSFVPTNNNSNANLFSIIERKQYSGDRYSYTHFGNFHVGNGATQKDNVQTYFGKQFPQFNVNSFNNNFRAFINNNYPNGLSPQINLSSCYIDAIVDFTNINFCLPGATINPTTNLPIPNNIQSLRYNFFPEQGFSPYSILDDIILGGYNNCQPLIIGRLLPISTRSTTNVWSSWALPSNYTLLNVPFQSFGIFSSNFSSMIYGFPPPTYCVYNNIRINSDPSGNYFIDQYKTNLNVSQSPPFALKYCNKLINVINAPNSISTPAPPIVSPLTVNIPATLNIGAATSPFNISVFRQINLSGTGTVNGQSTRCIERITLQFLNAFTLNLNQSNFITIDMTNSSYNIATNQYNNITVIINGTSFNSVIGISNIYS